MGRIYDEQDFENLRRVLESGRLGAHDAGFTGEFERQFAKQLGSKYGVAMNSAMSLLHAGVAAAGAGAGDEVICDPVVQFGAIATMYNNAVPVFADVDPKTHNIDVESVKTRITEYTKAIICTNLWGLPCELDKLRKVADEHHLLLIEDCAHALFAGYKGKHAGTWGHIGVFSFQQSKHLSTGDGGMGVTDDEKLASAMRNVGSFSASPARIAWTYRMTELVAAVGVAQLRHARDYVCETIGNAQIYAEAIADCEWLQPQYVPPDTTHAYHIYVPLFYGDKYGISYDDFKKATREVGCGVSFGYTQVPAYQYNLFLEPVAYGKGCPTKCPLYKGSPRYEKGRCPNAEEILPRMLLLSTGGNQEGIKRNAEKLRLSIEKVS